MPLMSVCVVDEIVSDFMRVVTDQFGCRVVQRMVEASHSHPSCRAISMMILHNVHFLCWDEYGHFPVETLLEHGMDWEKHIILQTLERGGFHGKGSYVQKKAIMLNLVQQPPPPNARLELPGDRNDEAKMIEVIAWLQTNARRCWAASEKLEEELRERHRFNAMPPGLCAPLSCTTTGLPEDDDSVTECEGVDDDDDATGTEDRQILRGVDEDGLSKPRCPVLDTEPRKVNPACSFDHLCADDDSFWRCFNGHGCNLDPNAVVSGAGTDNRGESKVSFNKRSSAYRRRVMLRRQT
jgi:hypothetical protein